MSDFIVLIDSDGDGNPVPTGPHDHWVVVTDNAKPVAVNQLSAGGKFPHADCGEACVKSILNSRGISAPVVVVEHDASAGDAGTSAAGLQKALLDFGVKSTVSKAYPAKNTPPFRTVMNPLFGRIETGEQKAYEAAFDNTTIVVADAPKPVAPVAPKPVAPVAPAPVAPKPAAPVAHAKVQPVTAPALKPTPVPAPTVPEVPSPVAPATTIAQGHPEMATAEIVGPELVPEIPSPVAPTTTNPETAPAYDNPAVYAPLTFADPETDALPFIDGGPNAFIKRSAAPEQEVNSVPVEVRTAKAA